MNCLTERQSQRIMKRMIKEGMTIITPPKFKSISHGSRQYNKIANDIANSIENSNGNFPYLVKLSHFVMGQNHANALIIDSNNDVLTIEVFESNGEMGPKTKLFFEELVSRLAERLNAEYLGELVPGDGINTIGDGHCNSFVIWYFIKRFHHGAEHANKSLQHLTNTALDETIHKKNVVAMNNFLSEYV